MSNDFQCFDHGNDNMIGNCRHSKPPTDGVWKIAPKHFKMLEDARAKYEALVHFARCRPTERASDNGVHPAVRFTKEVRALKREHSNWHHGYNSGMLAALRLITSLAMKESASIEQIENDQVDLCADSDEDGGIVELDEAQEAEFAIESHPFLDT